MEESISRKHNLVLAILHEEADAVLGVAGRVQRLNGDAANVERVAVLRRLGYLFAVLAADYFELAELRELGRSEAASEGSEGSKLLTSSSLPPAWSQ